MSQSLVFTIIGNDQPGLVEKIARTVNEYECNWLGSRMSRLGGKFAGMIQVEGSAAQLVKLEAELAILADLTVVAERSDAGVEEGSNRTLIVTMLGLDRPGIVREVSAELASHQLNVVDLETSVSQAAMTGGLLFHGRAVVTAGAEVELDQLSQSLDQISGRLGVDIELLEDALV